jgi:hypothetical protein
MLQSDLRATSEDVAAFVAQHLGERIETRRRAIELALAEAVERSRTRGVSEANEAKLRALLGSRGETPPSARSQATLGSAAVDAGLGPEGWPSRAPVVAAGAALAVGTLVALSVALRAVRAVRPVGAPPATPVVQASSTPKRFAPPAPRASPPEVGIAASAEVHVAEPERPRVVARSAAHPARASTLPAVVLSATGANVVSAPPRPLAPARAVSTVTPAARSVVKSDAIDDGF